jgi:hypothetical protein
VGQFVRKTNGAGRRWRLVPAVASTVLLAGVVLPGAAARADGAAAKADVAAVTLFSSTTPGYYPAVATVPSLVCAVQVSVAGGPGGAGFDGTGAPAGGAGAVVDATVPVSPGQVLDAEVGGAGQPAATAGEATEFFDAGQGGVGGGGGGGINAAGNGEAGGGGGGASEVSSTVTPLVVAGGGGGGGWVAGGLGGSGGQLGSDGGAGSPQTSGEAGGGTASGVPNMDFNTASLGGGTQFFDTPEYGDSQPNDGNGTVGGGGDGGSQGAESSGPNPPNELGGDGTGAPGSNVDAANGPVGAGGAGNTQGGDGGNGGATAAGDQYHGVGTQAVGGGGGGGGVGFAGGSGSDAGGGGGGWGGGSGTIYGNPGGGGGGSSYVATNIDGGSASSTLTTGEVTISYDPANDLCTQTVFYASAAAAPGSDGGATPTDPCDLVAALLRVPAGGTVFLVTAGAGVATSRYVGNFTVATSGTTTLTPVTIEPLPGLTAPPILDGDGPDAPAGEVCQTPPIPRDQIDYSLDILYPPCVKQVLTVASGVHATLEGTTMANATEDGFDVDGFGGGLDAEGQVTVLDDSFDDNSTGDVGGAILVGHDGSVAVTDSTFTDNFAIGDGSYDGGGAISTDAPFGPYGTVGPGGTLSVTGSTFDGNKTDDSGGAIVTDSLTPITDSTFVGNSARMGGAIAGDVAVTHSTFTSNTATYSGPTLLGAAEVAGDIFDGSCSPSGVVDDGYNVGTDTTCFGASPPSTDVQAADLRLGPLADNGGPTETIEPQPGSPAIGVVPALATSTLDGTSTVLCPTIDQRGVSSTGASCDAGSVQTNAAMPNPALAEAPEPVLLLLPIAAIGGLALYKRRRRDA